MTGQKVRRRFGCVWAKKKQKKGFTQTKEVKYRNSDEFDLFSELDKITCRSKEVDICR
jgi:hypothetical protein